MVREFFFIQKFSKCIQIITMMAANGSKGVSAPSRSLRLPTSEITTMRNPISAYFAMKRYMYLREGDISGKQLLMRFFKNRMWLIE